jgi:NAD(P)-dependent dehydrogenase (short-subunit alcohol dehydrogenase family)
MSDGLGSVPKHVLITGASSGIGAASASLLAEKGFDVIAGVLNVADQPLASAASDRLKPIRVDVTDEVSISAAVATVEQMVGEHGLFALVNNAGIVSPGPLELQRMSDFRRHLEVNLIGPVAMTQAFLPLIRLGKGRIVNVGSIGGHLVLPLHGAYSASKFGIEAVSDAFRLELRQWRIPVSHIDPGATETPIFGKTLAADRDDGERASRAGSRRVRRADLGCAPADRFDGRRCGSRRRAGRSRRQGAHGPEAEVALPRRPRRGSGRGLGAHRERRHQGSRRRSHGAPACAEVAGGANGGGGVRRGGWCDGQRGGWRTSEILSLFSR